MAREYKYLPRTKFIDVKLIHFRDYVDRGAINIHNIRTEDKPSYYLTKPLDEQTNVGHKKEVQG